MSVVSMFIGQVLPYISFAVFLMGIIYRLVLWATTPMKTVTLPAAVPLFAGQRSILASMGRIALDIFVFRSLLRYTGNVPLWILSLLFHYALLFILIRHMRYFIRETPAWIAGLQAVGIWAGVIILVPLLYLLLRRIVYKELRMISTFADYFALILILLVIVTGILMKFVYAFRVDVVYVKMFALSLLAFKPIPPPDNVMFLLHFLFFQLLLMYLPFSKLIHLGSTFFSVTRTHIFSRKGIK